MIYVCTMRYVSDRGRLAEVRPRHRRYVEGLLADGYVVAAGSFVPEDDGGLFLYDAPSFEDARRLVDADPYVRESVCSWELRAYEVHGANASLLRGPA